METDDTKRLDAILSLNVEIWPADNGDWLLLDFRETPPRTTEHKTGRDAIDAAMSR